MAFQSQLPPNMKIVVENHTDYDSNDLLEYFKAGLLANNVKNEKYIEVKYIEPGQKHGVESCCIAEIGRKFKEGKYILIGIPKTSKNIDYRYLSRVFEHEILHTKGLTHEGMSHSEYWSLGPIPEWAKGRIIRKRRN